MSRLANRRRTAFVVALAVPALLASVSTALAAEERAAVAGARPAWATASADRGALDPAATLDDVRVYLAGKDPAGLESYARAVSDPRGPDFRHFLSAHQIADRFGPSPAQTKQVTEWLSSSGLTVTGTDPHFVAARGPVSALQKAFGTELHDFADREGNHRAPAGEVTAPASVAKAVLGVTGLEDPAKTRVEPKVKADPDPYGPPPTIYRGLPCSDYWGQKEATDRPKVDGKPVAWTPCGYGPQELRTAYGIDKTGLTGKGVTVGVLDPYGSPTIEADLAAYNTKHNFQQFRPGQLKQYVETGGSTSCYGGAPGGLYIEEALDIEAVHAMAPDADVTYIGAKDCEATSLIDAVNRAVDGHLADMINNSWGIGSEPPSDAVRQGFEQAFQRAAVSGIGIYYSSGDCGYEDPQTPCGKGDESTRKQTNYPPESPWVTAVGGTTMGLDQNGHKIAEVGWGNVRSNLTEDGTGWTPAPKDAYPSTYTGGSGGGTSIVFRQPAYQAGVVPDKQAKERPDGSTSAYRMRTVPDISADGDSSTGMLVGYTGRDKDGVARYHETKLGGTSLSSPLIVGIQALAQQAQGSPIGFANPQIYARYGSPAYQDVSDTVLSVARNDLTNPNDPDSAPLKRLYTAGVSGPLAAFGGYDRLTGVGTPSASYVSSYRR